MSLDAIWARTEMGRKEAHRLHMAAVLAERAKVKAPVKPVVRPAATLAEILGTSGFENKVCLV